MKVLLDTDIGSDIDDAVCLAYLLMQPECDLLGVTTVTGEPKARAQMASALCRAAGRKVAIFAGAAQPLLIEQKQTHCQQAEALDRVPHDSDFPAGEAVDFLRRTIRANPGEVTLLTIGPLTNAGLLYALDPEVATLLRAHVLMAGSFGVSEALPAERRGREWNAVGDPHATAIVYRAPVPVHRSIGLDVTLQVQLPADEVRARFREHALLRVVLDFAEVWFRKRDRITFHDPLAAAVLFDETLCGYQRGRVAIELADPAKLGITRFEPAADGPHEVAATVDAERFFDHYFGVFTNGG